MGGEDTGTTIRQSVASAQPCLAPALALLSALQITAIWLFALGAILGLLPEVNLSFFGGGARAGHNNALLLNRSEAARRLGTSRITLLDKLRKYGLDKDEWMP